MDLYEQPWYIGDPTAMEAAFRAKQVDHLWLDDPKVIDRVAADTGNAVERTPSNGPVASRFLCNDSPAATTPFKDLRLRQAIHLALDRNVMVQQMLKGGGYVCGPVAQGIPRWAMSPAELAKKPGYRFDTQEREEDIAEAKRLWEAAGGSAVGKISVVTAGIPSYIPEFFPQFQATLKDVLGLEVEMDLDSTGYTKLVQGMAEKRIILSLAFDNGCSDPDDYIYPYFHTNGVRNSFNLSDPELDRLLDAQREEFDFQARHQIVIDIQNYLLDKTLAMVTWISPVNSEIYWTYVKNMWRAPWYGENFNRASMWIDQTDPNFQGKQA
jgi:peptide/nickel transport system substrate-binding protein